MVVAEVLPAFMEFCERGIKGELSRMYLSINKRDAAKVQQDLVIYLIQHPDFNLSKLDSLAASLADTPKNAVTAHWLFDYDSKQGIEDFLKEVPTGINQECAETVNGFAVIVEHGFDTREILTHFPYVTLKRDAKLCYAWMRKEQK